METKIGFIGQGWIGKHYADEFESRLYNVVRYSLEEPYIQNRKHIKECQVVFVAVPTPTTPEGFSFAPVRDALKTVAAGTVVVIKSTLLPGTTETLQAEYPDLYILHSPEFLVEATAAYDAANPERNLVGIPRNSPEFVEKAELVLRILPYAPYSKVMSAREAELVKYAGNGFLFSKVLFFNLLYDLAQALGCEWEVVREAIVRDHRIGESHTQPVHRSGHDVGEAAKPKRGAGGHCFIKDFEALRTLYKDSVDDATGAELLAALIEKNIALLVESNKDIDLLTGVYGEEISLRKA